MVLEIIDYYDDHRQNTKSTGLRNIRKPMLHNITAKMPLLCNYIMLIEVPPPIRNSAHPVCPETADVDRIAKAKSMDTIPFM